MKTVTEEQRERRRVKDLRRLAEVLTYKCDVYSAAGRVFSFQAPWLVKGGRLFHGDREYQPGDLWDGYGREITSDSCL